jgi:DNA processing protein
MNDRGLLDLIIALLPGLMPAEQITLLKRFESEEDFIAQSKEDIEKIINKNLKVYWDISEIRAKAEHVHYVCVKRSIKWVSYLSAEYPPLVREIYDPPPVLFYRGILPNPEKSLLGMVGTRHPSPEAASQAHAISCGAGLAGISVISGLALGIDAMSHRGNLSGGVPGYAVLGSGVDEIYPSTNRMLAMRIIESGGAIISEYPPGTRPHKWNFPARNRIIAALSRSVIIVEAPQKSGALITASFALDQGKDLWVASSGVGVQEGQRSLLYDKFGTVKLASDGAEVIYSVRDVLEKWNIREEHNDEASVPVWDTTGKELAASMASFLEIKL